MKLKIWQHCVLFLLVVAAIFSRRTDALLNPQFYAEDGAVWFANAWNLGWFHSLTLPEGGYLNTLPRLVCGLALLVPLKSAPLLLNLFGIAIQALPVNILLAKRSEPWGPLWLRGWQAAMYVALPNSNELNVTITNAHWHMAFIACLIVFSEEPERLAWRVFDVAVVLMAGLTGPWALVLTPLGLIFWWQRRQKWSLVLVALLGVCASVQAGYLLTHADRPVTPLGATFALFARLVAGQIYAGAIWGQNSLAVRSNIVLAMLVWSAGTGVLLYGLLKLRLEMKLFLVFSAIITAAALHTPLITGDEPRWQALAIDKGARYWFFPMLALGWTMLWAASQKRYQALRIFSLVCLGAMLGRAIPHDWHYWPYNNHAQFGRYVRIFENAPPQTKVTIPIYPDGHEMTLIKK